MRYPSVLRSTVFVLVLSMLCFAIPGCASADPAVATAPAVATVPAVATAPALTTGCADCHGVDGLAAENLDAPIIAGMPAVHIEEAIYAYRDGARQCRYEPLMCETVLHTTDERIADLAEHYAKQTRKSSNEEFDQELATKGAKIHSKLCSSCHVRPDDPAVADVLGIPLHGQRSVYLRYALQSYMDGRRENLLDAMEEKLQQVDADDIEALVSYYAGYAGPD